MKPIHIQLYILFHFQGFSMVKKCLPAYACHGSGPEYNVVALLDRLLTDLNSHYKEKLLSIAEGSFDGHFRRQFKGKGKTKKDGGQGFIISTEDEHLRFAETVKKFPNDIFEVESLSKENVRYV